MSNLTIEKKAGYAIATLNRPETLNALDRSVLTELGETISLLESDNSLRGVLLVGSGKAFVAGADIQEMSTMTETEAYAFSTLANQVFRAWEVSPLVTIALVNGFALGGGLELALSCDIRFASDKAKLGFPEVGLGLLPGFGGTQRLSRLAGVGVACEWIFSGEMYPVEEAFRLGIVNRIFSGETLLQEGEQYLQKVLSKGPIAVKSAKMAIRQGIEGTLERGIEWEKQLFSGLFQRPESIEGLGAFLQKRKPNFSQERS